MTLHLHDAAVNGFRPFEAAGFAVPGFDRAAMLAASVAAPRWLHVGAGNLFRSFHARLAQDLLDRGLIAAGIHLVDVRDADRAARYNAAGELFVDVVLGADGSISPTLVGSVAETIHVDGVGREGWPRFAALVASPSLQLISLAVTEKAYAVTDDPRGTMAMLCAALQHRFETGAAPLALLSTDNMPGNGEVLGLAIRRVAERRAAQGSAPVAFLDWLGDARSVAFPSSVIDRITPAPSPAVSAALAERFGFGDGAIVRRAGRSPIAMFSNTEEFALLVVEDAFPNGRPPFEQVGVLMTDRETVDRVEQMKVGAALNPLHTAMAVLGDLLGFTTIAAESRDPDVAVLIRRLASEEALPAIAPPGVVDPLAFLDEVLERRFPNPGLPDTPQRIATDTSQKLAPRFAHTIAHALDGGRGHELRFVPFVIAAWLRYLLGVDDAGHRFEPSPDPLLDALRHDLADVRVGEPDSVGAGLDALLARTDVFGHDLTGTAVADTVEATLRSMLRGPGAVRAALREAVGATARRIDEGVPA